MPVPILDTVSRWPKGFIPPGYSSTSTSHLDTASLDPINPGIGLSRFTSTPGTNAHAAFQGLLNNVTNNPAVFTPGYNPQIPTTGHSQQFDQLLNAIDTKTITGSDATGTVSVGPRGLTFDSGKGFSGRVNPQGAGIKVGPVDVQGTWAGDKSIQANIKLGRDNTFAMGMGMPRFMSEFVTPEPIKQTDYPMLESDSKYIDKVGNIGSEFIPIPQQGFGLQGINPLAPEGQRYGVLAEQPLSEARKLMEQQTEEYAARNPLYRYQ